jgi:hypothetical protein
LPAAAFDAIGYGVLIPFVEPVRFAEVFVGERVGIGQCALECLTPSGNQRGAEIHKRVVTAPAVDDVRSTPKRPVMGLVHHGIEQPRKFKRSVL